jgi:hypothetical protein
MAGKEALGEPRMVIHGDEVKRAAKTRCADEGQTWLE